MMLHILIHNVADRKMFRYISSIYIYFFTVTLVQSIVLDVCRRKNYMLDQWVKELFDIDGKHCNIVKNI
jgi:hypothetical protein